MKMVACGSWMSTLTIAYWTIGCVSVILSLIVPQFEEMSLYGKLRDPKQIGLTVPKSWFTHFYVIAVSWSFLLLIASIYDKNLIMEGIHFAISEDSLIGIHLCTRTHLTEDRQTDLVALALFAVHACRRLYESVFLSVYSTAARMHISGYIIGTTFYVAAPWTIIMDSGFLLEKSMTSFIYVIGIPLFVIGSWKQHEAHAILAKLRERNNEYRIPNGGWFSYVSSPHYLSEILLYAGLVFVVPFRSFRSGFMLLFIVLNLYTSALRTHRWYHLKFEAYPKSRYAILPYIV